MQDSYIFNSRYGDNTVYLIKIADNTFRLNPGNQNDDFMRLGLREGYTWEDKEYEFIDPFGGPFLSIGTKLDSDTEIESISLKEIDEKPMYIIKTKNINEK